MGNHGALRVLLDLVRAGNKAPIDIFTFTAGQALLMMLNIRYPQATNFATVIVRTQ